MRRESAYEQLSDRRQSWTAVAEGAGTDREVCRFSKCRVFDAWLNDFLFPSLLSNKQKRRVSNQPMTNVLASSATLLTSVGELVRWSADLCDSFVIRCAFYALMSTGIAIVMGFKFQFAIVRRL